MLSCPAVSEHRNTADAPSCSGVGKGVQDFGTGVDNVMRDLGQWENSQPTIRAWFNSLMRPDIPTLSCCGEADGHCADEISPAAPRTKDVI